jgi:hypothetical protein
MDEELSTRGNIATAITFGSPQVAHSRAEGHRLADRLCCVYSLRIRLVVVLEGGQKSFELTEVFK